MRWCLLLAGLLGCGAAEPATEKVHLTLTGSSVGAEGEVLRRQLGRFMKAHPKIEVALRPTPDAADQRHQLLVTWLNAGAREPDVLQLDVVWTPEFASAGWILRLDVPKAEEEEFFEAALRADRFEGRLYALPWFIDVGLLYYRTDLVKKPPATLEEMEGQARAAMAEYHLPYGVVWQGARYEGLVTTFLEYLGAEGGSILDDENRVTVDAPAAVRALTRMRDQLSEKLVPREALLWQEEQARFAFQNGQAVFMRNWPYAWREFKKPAQSQVVDRVAVAPLPAAQGRGHPTAALGGAQLAINANSAHPKEAWALIQFLLQPEQLVERAKMVGQFPPRRSLYEGTELDKVLPASPAEVKRILEDAVPRPVTPVYAQLSRGLQVHLHRALSGQKDPPTALSAAAREMRALLATTGDVAHPSFPMAGVFVTWVLPLGLFGALSLAALMLWRRRPILDAELIGATPEERRLARYLVAPALALVAVMALFPLVYTLWESLHEHDLRLPQLGRPFVGLANYAEALRSARIWEALGHTALFAVVSVTLELALGLALALALHRAWRGRGLMRAAVLAPWALPTVVAALVWRFLFEQQGGGLAGLLVQALGLTSQPPVWLADPTGAWMPLVLADVWKTTPFVALLLLAGLQNIDPAVYDAARIDGANRWQELWRITLPLLRPALVVALVFRTLDALRLFDLVYVLTGGGPGTATEPIALHTFDTLLSDMRFGDGSALSVLVFLLTFGLALVYLRVLGGDLTRGPR